MYKPILTAASDDRFAVLWLDTTRPDEAHFDPIVFHLFLADEYTERGRTGSLGTIVFPVAISLYSNSNKLLDDLAERMLRDTFWELRRCDDLDGVLARLNSAFSCGLTCRWSVVEDKADAGVSFIRHHGPDCDLADEDDDRGLGYRMALPGGAS